MARIRLVLSLLASILLALPASILLALPAGAAVNLTTQVCTGAASSILGDTVSLSCRNEEVSSERPRL